MSLKIKFADSVSLWTFQKINDWRNGYLGKTIGYNFRYREDMSCPEITFKRFLSECAYPFILVAFIVESCFRMTVGYIVDLFEYIFISEENQSEFEADYNDKVWGSLTDTKIPAPLFILSAPFVTVAILIGNIFMEHLEIGIIYQNTIGCCPCIRD
jgi:hypothetical protein